MYSAWKNEPADTNKNAHATSQQPLLSYYVIPVVWFQSLQVGSRSRLRSGCTHRCHDIMGRASNMSMQQEDTCKYAHRAKGSHGEVRTSPATNRENVSSDFANRNSNWLNVVRYPHSHSADSLAHKSKHMHWLPLAVVRYPHSH